MFHGVRLAQVGGRRTTKLERDAWPRAEWPSVPGAVVYRDLVEPWARDLPRRARSGASGGSPSPAGRRLRDGRAGHAGVPGLPAHQPARRGVGRPLAQEAGDRRRRPAAGRAAAHRAAGLAARRADDGPAAAGGLRGRLHHRLLRRGQPVLPARDRRGRPDQRGQRQAAGQPADGGRRRAGADAPRAVAGAHEETLEARNRADERA